MKSRQIIFIKMGTVIFSIVGATFPANAFTVSYSYSPNLTPVSYTVGNLKGQVWIDPIQKISPPDAKLIKAFQSQFPEWEFESSNTLINGNINITWYQPCNPQDMLGCQQFSADGSLPIKVGGRLDLEYEPQKENFFDPELGKDITVTEFPDPNTGQLHWLQWVESNHKVIEDAKNVVQGHNIPESIIDTKSKTPFYYGDSLKEKPDDPFYFFSNKRDPYNFHDIPGRGDIWNDHDWTANLYLAYQKNDAEGNYKKVQIFGGISWGWHNEINKSCPASRVDATITPVGNQYLYEFEVFNTSPIMSGSGYGNEEICDEIVDWELPLFDVNDLDIASISTPSGWDFEILPPDGTSDYYNNSDSPYNFSKWNYNKSEDPLLSINPEWYGSNPEVFEDPPLILHWYNVANTNGTPTNSILPGNSLTEFSFLSDFAPKNAPYLASWYTAPPDLGDPPIPIGSYFGTPNSPARQIAQGDNISTSVPEPNVLFSLLGFGILGFKSKLKK